MIENKNSKMESTSSLQSIYRSPKGYYYKITSDQKKKRIGLKEFQFLTKKLKVNAISNSTFSKDLEVKDLDPLLKWAGGKQRLAKQIATKIPSQIENFYDPFLGGGNSLLIFLSLKKRTKIKISGNIYASDLNNSVINFYEMVQKRPNQLYKFIKFLEKKFLDSTEEQKKSYYYFLRKKFNKIKILGGLQCATLFYFLNRTCFGGIYRENKKGYFNVPYGNFRKIKLLEKTNFFEISDLIQKIIFKEQTFEIFSKTFVFEKNDFIYLDPPYFPTNKNSFTNYLSFGFDSYDHQYMFDWILSLEKEVFFLLHNSYTKQLLDLFSSTTYIKDTIFLTNSLKYHNKSTRKELLITNYHSNYKT